jgi:hypothetical protein
MKNKNHALWMPECSVRAILAIMSVFFTLMFIGYMIITERPIIDLPKELWVWDTAIIMMYFNKEKTKTVQ